MSETIDPKDVDLNNDEDLDLENDPEGADDPNKQGDDPPKDLEPPKDKKELTDEQRLAIYERKAKAIRKKLGKDSDAPKDNSKDKAPKSGDLDYGQLAFYNTKSDAVKIESDEDIEFLKDTIADTGKSQQAILGSKWFQAELKERAESKRSADAVPKGTKRPSQSSRDSVDYWLAKDELPENTPENQELRRKVVAAKIAKANSGSNFSPSSTGNIVRQSQVKK